MMLEQDTIAAIATGSGGGIGVIRISGPKAFEITGKIFRGRKTISEIAIARTWMPSPAFLSAAAARSTIAEIISAISG